MIGHFATRAFRILAHGLLFGSFSPVLHNNVCAKYWPMGFYSEENCQTEAHGPLLDWASGRKAPVCIVIVIIMYHNVLITSYL